MNSFWKGKRVLLTGANGFLGSHLTLALLDKGAFVLGVIKENSEYSYLRISLKKAKQPKLKIIRADIANFKPLLSIFKNFKPDICLHIAAQPIVDISKESPLPTFEANIKGTWNILEIARLCKGRAVVVASNDKACTDYNKRALYKEDAVLQASNPYDSSKACVDILTRCYAGTYGLNTAVTRCANVYGPGDFNFSRIIPDVIRALISGKRPLIRSDGTPLRDYIFVDDITEAYLLLAEKLYKKEIKAGEAFNFCTGKPISVLTLVNKIIEIAKRRDLSPVLLIKRRIKGGIDNRYLSSLKAKKMLGWRCQHSLREGLKTTLDWYIRYLGEKDDRRHN